MVLSSFNATNTTEEVNLGKQILELYDKDLKFVYPNDDDDDQDCPTSMECITPENKCAGPINNITNITNIKKQKESIPSNAISLLFIFLIVVSVIILILICTIYLI